MDGVLVDFDKGYTELTGMTPKKAENILSPKEFWAPISAAGAKYWSDLSWMMDGKQLWEYIKQYNPAILTSPSRDKTSIIGKAKWCAVNIPGYKVFYSQNKHRYATPESILIDDKEKNIENWERAGGIGILHKSAATTIKDLKKLEL